MKLMHTQSLKLRQKQSLVMTPQLQQAIKLLQMSNLELSQHLQDQVYDNPFLELDVKENSENVSNTLFDQKKDLNNSVLNDSHLKSDNQNSDVNELDKMNESNALKDDPTENFEVENRFDSSISDNAKISNSNKSNSERDFDYMQNIASEIGFYEKLIKQINLNFIDTKEKLIAEKIINCLEPTGWVSSEINDISLEIGVSENTVEKILFKLQNFEPAGIFARNLSECLALQLKDLNLFTDDYKNLLNNLDLLGKGNINQISRKIKCTNEEIMDMLKTIRTLNPKPGEHLGIDYKEVPSPDVIVYKKANKWIVELNNSTLPAIEVNEKYAQEIVNKKQSPVEKNYSSEAITNARWLKRAVEQRNQTTLKISTEIIRHQIDFLEKGLDYLKPLSLRDIASNVSMHESTVSRVTTGLLISTPRGGMPLKSFFSVNISSKDSVSNSSAASVRNMVKKIINQEVPGKPLSDEAISNIISNQGIELARRTVAKYREMLNIPSSSQRRTQAKLSNLR